MHGATYGSHLEQLQQSKIIWLLLHFPVGRQKKIDVQMLPSGLLTTQTTANNFSHRYLSLAKRSCHLPCHARPELKPSLHSPSQANDMTNSSILAPQLKSLLSVFRPSEPWKKKERRNAGILGITAQPPHSGDEINGGNSSQKENDKTGSPRWFHLYEP
ncbi:hypothetical protein PoB_001099500 [Plakobranchus ocellatus]|uniref:Uncharacterized protein n=1 Tax=Plakobranchus ocellatus TaxID=259542 RepID=A0AAV3YPX7_9GAST|nr:hypothetical protein PoB_001099500 [Plakobranchus ocellatus]